MNRRYPISHAILAASVATLSAIVPMSYAHADGKPACPMLLASAASDLASPHRLHVVKTEKLFRTEQRPYALVPEGVAIWIRAPQGVTAADLHSRLSECVKQAGEHGTPVCVEGARISVEHSHGLYLVHVKSQVRSQAIEIQKRAARL